MTNISYKQCIDDMYGRGRFGIRLGMDTTKGILQALGSPEKEFKSIHIAGTNGKGSIASYIASILYASGFKTGLYTSPHLIKFNERFSINGCEVCDDDVVEAYLAVEKADKGKRKATFFELATAMAFYLFGKSNVDWAVIETGMGGRLDATNILKPEVSVISNLSIEHTMYLGNTIEEIAMEKGGIIKNNTPVVSGVSEISALSVLQNIAKKKSAPFYLYKKDFKTQTYPETASKNLFSYDGIKNKWTDLKINLHGEHQIENAAIALAAIEVVFSNNTTELYNSNNTNTDSNFLKNTVELERAVKNGLANTKWPGRLEYIMKNPVVIIDGAHNLNAAENLGKYLKKNIQAKQLTMVIGILDDKPYKSMLNHILPCADKIIFTKAAIERSIDPLNLKEYAMTITKAEINIIDNVAHAVDYAIANSSAEDAVCIAGSLYVAGEARKRIQERE